MKETTRQELTIKLNRIHTLLDQHQADGLLLRKVSSFAWATCGGASYVNTAASEGGASLLITRDHQYLTTTNIEAPRLIQEEGLEEQGWEFHVAHWTDPQATLGKLVNGLKLVSDVPFQSSREIGAEISRLRANLTQFEEEKFRLLGKLCAETMGAAVMAVKPGMSEYQIASLLGGAAQQRGIQPIVNLIATDERIFQYRHPLPTDKRLQKYALLVLSGRKWGLVCSISRLVHFGAIPADTQRRIDATMRVNAAFISGTRAGRTLGEIFLDGQAAYGGVGFADEWQHHHQGGVTGYEPREYLGMPGSTVKVLPGQALAWNPSIAGAKAEDTILVGAQQNEILTRIQGWPEVTNNGVVCPQALVIE